MQRRLTWMLATAVVVLSITLLVMPTRTRRDPPPRPASPGWITPTRPAPHPRTVDAVRSTATRLRADLQACQDPDVDGASVTLELRGPRVEVVRGPVSSEVKACVLAAFAAVAFEDGAPLAVEIRLPTAPAPSESQRP